jgi:hypothetical protein
MSSPRNIFRNFSSAVSTIGGEGGLILTYWSGDVPFVTAIDLQVDCRYLCLRSSMLSIDQPSLDEVDSEGEPFKFQSFYATF